MNGTWLKLAKSISRTFPARITLLMLIQSRYHGLNFSIYENKCHRDQVLGKQSELSALFYLFLPKKVLRFLTRLIILYIAQQYVLRGGGWNMLVNFTLLHILNYVKHYMLKYNDIFTPHIWEACVTYTSCIYIGSWIAHIEPQFTQVTSSISLLEHMLVYTSTYSYIAYSHGVKCSFTGRTSEPPPLSLASYHNLVFQHRGHDIAKINRVWDQEHCAYILRLL